MATAGTTINVLKATPTITWPTPANISYGTPLGNTQLDATASAIVNGQSVSVAGVYTYGTPAGTFLHAGNSQPLTVTFNPTDSTDFTSAMGATTITVSPAMLTLTANNQNKAYGATLPALTVSYSGFVNGDTPASLTTQPTVTTTATASSPAGNYAITVTGAVDPNYTITYVNGTLTIAPAPNPAAIIVLDPTVAGALTLSGNAGINTTGSVVVDSCSASAILASGNSSLKAGGGVLVVGGVSKSGNASVTKTGTPSATSDPLASLTAPTASGSVISVNLSGNSSLTINPGIYSGIGVSGNAKLSFRPGIYVIEGGGFTVSGNASVAGSGVMIYNSGTTYHSSTGSDGSGGTYGTITLSGNGTFNLSAPASGAYAGILLFQDRNDARALSLSGNAMAALTGTIYAPKAQLVLSGNAQLKDTLIVDTLSLSGNVVTNLAQNANGARASAGPDPHRLRHQQSRPGRARRAVSRPRRWTAPDRPSPSSRLMTIR